MPALNVQLQNQFRDAMAAVASPVSVVTTLADGEPYGTTVSAFTSLSMDPPMALVSLDSRSDLLAAIRRSGRFALNILGHHQAALARTFASKGGPGKFDGVEWAVSDGLPRLPGSAAWLACEIVRLVKGGDHVVAMGLVVRAETCEARPLTYHGRAFGTHAALEPA